MIPRRCAPFVPGACDSRHPITTLVPHAPHDRLTLPRALSHWIDSSIVTSIDWVFLQLKRAMIPISVQIYRCAPSIMLI